MSKLTFPTALLSLMLAACGQPRPIPSGTDTHFYGLIAEGSKFGVTIDDTRDVARETLTAQAYRLAGTVDCRESGLQNEIPCQPGDEFDVYSQHQWLEHQTVFVEVKDERVTMIGWSFVLLQIDS